MKAVKFYTILSLVALLCGNLNAQTLHAIIFADTDAGGGIATSLKNDLNSMVSEISNIQTATGLTLDLQDFNEEFCNKETLLETLKDLRCQPNDIVVFYYTGHGARAIDDVSKFPQLTFGETDSEAFPLYRIDEIIATKRPKFRLVMADCCNSETPFITVKSNLSKGKSVVGKSSSNIYKQLFTNATGSVVVASSKAGQTSGLCLLDGMERGTFTACFETELQKMASSTGQVSWNSLLENAKISTMNAYNSVPHKQEPVYEIKLDGASISSTVTTTSNVAVPQTNDRFITALIRMADNGETLRTRLDLVKPTLQQWFASSAIVEVFGRSGKVRLTRETAEDFLNRISTAHKLTNFAELEKKTDGNGKITYLKLHEIYKQ